MRSILVSEQRRLGRRAYLGATAATVLTSLAGCQSPLGGDGDGTDANASDADASDADTGDADASAPIGWPMYGGDAGNTGHVATANPTTPPITDRWRFDPSLDEDERQSILVQPVVRDGRVFVAATDGRLWALDLASGEQLWTHEFAGTADRHPLKTGMAVDDRHLYVPALDSLYALDPATGETVWSDERNRRIGAVAPLDDRLIACEPWGGAVLVWDRDGGTATRIHQFEDGTLGQAVAVADGTAVLHVDADVCGVSLGGGVEWRYTNNETSLTGTNPVTDGERVYAAPGTWTAEDEQTCFALDLGSGEQQWTFEPGETLGATPTVAGDRVYLQSTGDRDDSPGHFWGLEASTGEPTLSKENTTGFGKPVVAGSMAYVNGYDAEYAVDLESGSVAWTRDTYAIERSPPPVFVDGAVIFSRHGYGVHAAVPEE